MRRAALDDIRDIHAFARNANRAEKIIQKLSCRADKGFALQILLFTRPFADEHQIRRDRPDAEHYATAPGAQRAPRAGKAGFTKRLKPGLVRHGGNQAL